MQASKKLARFPKHPAHARDAAFAATPLRGGSSRAIRHRPAARFLAVSTILAFFNLPGSSLAESACSGIHVTILDIRNSTGSVACALFDSPEGFPEEFLRHASHIMMMKIKDTKGQCDFLDIDAGTYALAVVHDENMDGKIDTNWLGIPTEGYGFSAGATISMGAPSFEDASFPYDGEQLELEIRLTY